jgi:hypothetical protein
MVDKNESEVVVELVALHSLRDLPVYVVAVEGHALPQVLRELEHDSDEEVLQLGQDVVGVAPVPGFDKDTVLGVEAEVGLEIVHDECGLHVPPQHGDVLSKERATFRDSPIKKVRWLR